MDTNYKYLLLILFLFFGLNINSLSQQLSTEINALTKGADVILTGKVTQQAASWNENKTRIYTRATIQVDEYIKGNSAGSTVTVKYLGGEVGEIGEMYSHMPRFEDNEEVLVFLKKDEKSSEFKVFNGENGKISVIEDPQTGDKVTTSNVRISSLKTQIKSYIND
ncbi:MAG: hypothetical protein ACW99A_19865 [Candidatus Kariarchaeaceae archaeon]|jgi:hypothetical protein